jgi:murein DD-endopeptidase MepM/ murein hydrolase activator NlpD
MFLRKSAPSFALLFLVSMSVEAQIAWSTLTVNPSSYTSSSVSLYGHKYFKFTGTAGYRYSVCVNTTTTTGNADLYGSTSADVSRTKYSAKSASSGTEDECIFIPSSSPVIYYFAVYGYKASNFQIYVIGSKIKNVPTYMKFKLRCPVDDGLRPSLCGTPPTTSKYGPFGSPWGNADDGPFFTGSQNHFHNGVDYPFAAGTQIRAVYKGTVVKTGDLGLAHDGNSWGKYIVVQHSIDGNTFTSAYLHLSGLTVAEGAVSRGQVLGKVADISVAGEVDHLHFTIHTGAYRSSTPKSQQGSILYSSWQTYGTVFINPDITTNPDLYEGIGIPP